MPPAMAWGRVTTRSSRASGRRRGSPPGARSSRRGWRVAYVDIDAHHGDGVQFAFYRDPNVLTVSTHERGDRLFPGTGFVAEMGEGDGLGYSVNVPLQPLTDDAVYHEAFEAVERHV